MTMMSTPISKPAAPAAKADPTVQPAQTVSDRNSTSTSTAAAPSAAGAPFAQWLGQQAGTAPGPQAAGALAAALAALADDVNQAALPATPGTDAASTDGAEPATGADDASETQANPLLAAMAMPLMPLTPMQIAQAVQSAQGGATAATDTAGGDGKPDAAPALTGTPQNNGRRADVALPPALATAPLPATAQAQARPDDGAVRVAVQAATQGGAHAGGAASDAGPQDGGAPAPATPALAGALPAGATATAAAPADTVKLAGPPTAWRQSLQEALGDRLHLQVGKGVEQAVIRLEPPQLGRIDIAIRHSNGTLEVNISATNGEVLRQLQTVSDNLRSDLAQRQYTEVAVSVTPAPKGNGAAPFGDPQQQGRGRQQNREQDEPGRALAEASNATSAFTLGGRDS